MNFKKPSKVELQTLYLTEKLTLQEIADKYGVSRASVCRWLKKAGIKTFSGRNKKTPLSKDVLHDLYVNQNYSSEQIAKQIGVNKVTVLNWLRASNIKRKDITEPKEIPSKEVLEDLYLKQFKTLNEIGAVFNVNRNLVSKWLNSYNIKIRMFGIKIEPPTEEILRELYENQKLTIKKIATIYDTNDKTVARWLVKNNINIRSNQRKYYHLKAVPFTRIQKEFIVGTMLGDGCLVCTGKKKSVRLLITHSVKQIDYFFWKKNIMGNFINNVNVYKEKKRNSTKISSASIYHNEFKFYYNLFYDNCKKVINNELGYYLTPFAMAVWIMDDGWINHGINIRISSESFSKEENEFLVQTIKTNFDINSKVLEYTKDNKKYYYIAFNKRNSILLTKLIEPYVIDSMKYKLVNLPLLND